MSPVSRFLCLFILPAMGGASPLEEMMVRVEQYKEKALTAPGCGFWREVLRLHHKVLLKKSSPGASNKSSRHLATVMRSSWLMMVIVWMISTWQPSPGSCSRSGTTRCGARQPATVFWLDLQFSLGGSTIKVGPEPCLVPSPLAQEASFTRMVWISSTGVRTTRWAGRCVEVSLIQTQVLRTVPGWPRLCLKSSAFRHHLPGKIFFLLTFWCQGSNSTGSALRAKGKERLMRWLDFRGRFGFSEYNADTYGPISFAPLVTVAALAPDPEVT